MQLIDLVTGPWALVPEKLSEIQDIYAHHVRGERVDLAAVEARIGRVLANEPKPYEVVNGVAILPIHGVIAPKASMFMDVSGGVSAQRVQRDLAEALDDPGVTAIIQYSDTPGGSVLGTPELAAAFQAARARKPVVSFSDGQMLSAGVWMGTAADAIYISGPTVNVGSIGVVAMHRDFSAREAQMGVKTTEVTAGTYKRIESQYAPLTKAGRAHMQERVDYLYSLFVDAVAAQRGTSVERVLGEMADARIFIGQQAIDVGLADGMMSLNDLIDALATDPRSVIPSQQGKAVGSSRRAAAVSSNTGAQAPVSFDASERTETMTTPEAQAAATAAAVSAAVAGLNREGLQAGNPALFGALEQEFKGAGATAERERIQAVMAQGMPGHEGLVQQLAFDGKTTGPEAAVAVLGAHRQALAKAGSDHFADAPGAAASSASAAASAAAGGSEAKSREQKAAEATALAREKGISFVAAYKELGFDKQ